MKAAWIYPFIILGGMLQAVGAPMNGQRRRLIPIRPHSLRMT
jgi:bacterial/archaeal transporter family-2 protein